VITNLLIRVSSLAIKVVAPSLTTADIVMRSCAMPVFVMNVCSSAARRTSIAEEMLEEHRRRVLVNDIRVSK
jgi:hypothetical protein